MDSSQTRARRYRANTNLEDVSDWLTKIIVGIGIAQFPAVVLFFRGIGDSIGEALGGAKTDEVIGLASVLYGLVCGFLYYYVWTRLVFQRNLEGAEP